MPPRRVRRRRPTLGRAAFIIAATAVTQMPTAHPAHAEDPVEHFHVAPETARDDRLLLQVTLNGMDLGTQLIERSGDAIVLPAETLKAMHIAAPPGQTVRLEPKDATRIKLDVAASTLVLDLPPSAFELQRFAPDAPQTPSVLSRESWGAFLNYDVNARQLLSGDSTRSNRGTGFGGLADLRVIGPDLLGDFGWAYDDSRGRAPFRLDSVVTWRPTDYSLAASLGDTLSPGDALALSRPYRYLGVQVGTDFSGTPGWSSATIASVAGSAQAQSSLDLFINDQRAYSASTPGGPFSLQLPAGVGAGDARLVVTDITGRAVVVPISIPRVNAQLIRQDMFLWSAGIGVPRFGYGSANSTYAADPYAYGTARYGLSERMTVRSEAEFGQDLQHVQAGIDAIATPTLAVRGTIAASHSSRGSGAAGRIAVSYFGPWGLTFDLSAKQSIGRFDDVVSVSGRNFARRGRIDSRLYLPSDSEMTARLSWQLSERLTASASYQADRYPDIATVGIASLSVNYIAGNVPLFLNAFHSLGGRRSTTILAGMSFQFGAVQGSVSAGAGFGGSTEGDRGWNGSVNAAQPLHEEIGSVGWGVFGTRSPTGMFGAASADYRSGYGIPGIGVQAFGKVVSALATARGSVGVVAGHPFVGDPVENGGIVIVDADRSGVPVELNGYDRGRTSFDGKLALVNTIPGVPQNIAIDATRLPFDAVPSVTEGRAIVRLNGATSMHFKVDTTGQSARFRVRFQGQAPPVGSTAVAALSSVPVSKEGNVYIPTLAPGEVVRIEMPDGTSCAVNTDFDGQGGIGRHLGTLPCDAIRN